VTSSGGEWQVVEGLDVGELSRERIDASVRELEEEREAVRSLGLV
jgi:malate dehydrogenase